MFFFCFCFLNIQNGVIQLELDYQLVNDVCNFHLNVLAKWPRMVSETQRGVSARNFHFDVLAN